MHPTHLTELLSSFVSKLSKSMPYSALDPTMACEILDLNKVKDSASQEIYRKYIGNIIINS